MPKTSGVTMQSYRSDALVLIIPEGERWMTNITLPSGEHVRGEPQTWEGGYTVEQ